MQFFYPENSLSLPVLVFLQSTSNVIICLYIYLLCKMFKFVLLMTGSHFFPHLLITGTWLQLRDFTGEEKKPRQNSI
jgi:hypothetical protein